MIFCQGIHYLKIDLYIIGLETKAINHSKYIVNIFYNKKHIDNKLNDI